MAYQEQRSRVFKRLWGSRAELDGFPAMFYQQRHLQCECLQFGLLVALECGCNNTVRFVAWNIDVVLEWQIVALHDR